MAAQAQIRLVSRKLKTLKEDKEALSSALDGYISHILTAGSEWVQSQGSTGQTCQEICIGLDQTMMFIAEKLDEISESSEKSTSISLSTSTQLPSPSPGTSLLPKRLSSALADHVLLKLEERVEALESEMTTVSEKMEELKDIKSDLEETTESIQELKDTSGKEERKLSTLKTRFDDLLETFNTSAKEYTTNKNKNDSLFKKLEQRVSVVDKDLDQLTSDVTKVVKRVNRYDDRFGEVDRKLVSIDARFVEVEEENDAAITYFRGLEEGLETCQAQLEKVDGLNVKVRQVEEERERDMSRIKDVDEKLGKLEEERIDLEIQRLGILEDRLLGVEEERQNDIKDIGDVKEHLKTLSTQIQAVEKKQEEQHQPVGFTAYTDGILRTTSGDVIKGFNKILSNKGGHYDATTGVFTAPVSGTFLVAFCHRQHGQGMRFVSFCHERVSTGQRNLEITGTWTYSHYACSSNVIVVDMEEEDKLYLKPYAGGDIRYPCAFSCALLG